MGLPTLKQALADEAAQAAIRLQPEPIETQPEQPSEARTPTDQISVEIEAFGRKFGFSFARWSS